jgi:hypothetical protein
MLSRRCVMQTHPLHVTHARERALEIRTELFAFGDVLDVFATGDPDVVVVACSGRPHPAEWLRVLRAAGYEIPGRRRARAPQLLWNVVDSVS